MMMASGSVVHSMLRRLGLPAAGPDKTTVEGLSDRPYEFASQRVEHLLVASPVPIGFWRSVGHSHNAFATESFIDECAHAAKADPFEFRMKLLSRKHRLKWVLELAAEKAGWGSTLPQGMGRGIAVHGSRNVPLHPASHGCIRISMEIGNYFPSLVANGDKVYVWDGVKEPEAQTKAERTPPFDYPNPDATTSTTSTSTTLPASTTTAPASTSSTTTTSSSSTTTTSTTSGS